MPLSEKKVFVPLSGGLNEDISDLVLPTPQTVKAENLTSRQRGVLAKRAPINTPISTTAKGAMWADTVDGISYIQGEAGINTINGSAVASSYSRPAVTQKQLTVTSCNTNAYSLSYDRSGDNHVVGFVEGTTAYVVTVRDGVSSARRVVSSGGNDAQSVAVVATEDYCWVFVCVTGVRNIYYARLAWASTGDVTSSDAGLLPGVGGTSTWCDACLGPNDYVYVYQWDGSATGSQALYEITGATLDVSTDAVYTDNTIGAEAARIIWGPDSDELAVARKNLSATSYTILQWASATASVASPTATTTLTPASFTDFVPEAGNNATDSNFFHMSYIPAGLVFWFLIAEDVSADQSINTKHAIAAYDFDSGTRFIYGPWNHVEPKDIYNAINYKQESPILSHSPVYNAATNDLMVPLQWATSVSTSPGSLVLVPLEVSLLDSTYGPVAVTGHMAYPARTYQNQPLDQTTRTHISGDVYSLAYMRAAVFSGDIYDAIPATANYNICITEFDFTPADTAESHVPSVTLADMVISGGSVPYVHNSGVSLPLGPIHNTRETVKEITSGFPGDAKQWASPATVVVDTLYACQLYDGRWIRTVGLPATMSLAGSPSSITVESRSLNYLWWSNFAQVITQSRFDDGVDVYYSAPNYAAADTTSLVTGYPISPLVLGDDPYQLAPFLDETEQTPMPWPPVYDMAVFDDVIWVIDADDRSQLYFSKPLETGLTPEMSLSRVETVSRAATAISTMDNKVLVFFTDGVGFFAGPGLDKYGRGAGYRYQDILSHVGPYSPRHVVSTRNGVLYERDGIFYRLLRNLTIERIDAVQLKAGETLTYSYYAVGKDEARFLTSDDRVYVYNVGDDIWTTYTTTDKSLSWGAEVVIDGAVSTVFKTSAAGELTPELDLAAPRDFGIDALDSQADLFFTDHDSSTGSGITTTYKSGWIPLDGIGGYARLKEIQLIARQHLYDDAGDPVTAHSGVTIKVAYDYNPTVVDTFTFSASTVESMGARLQLKCKPSVQKIESFQIEITEVPEVGSPGYTLIGLALRVGLKSTLYKKLDSSRRG